MPTPLSTSFTLHPGVAVIHPTTLILDGIFGRPSRFGPLRRLLESTCGPTEVFHYNSTGFVRFEELAQRLCHRIEEIGHPVNVLGFSMGGIVIRTAHLLCPSLPIRRAVFLNSPHAGSRLAYIMPLAPGVRQLWPGSSLMQQLDQADWTIPTLVTWCPLDAAIIPAHSANWPKATESIRCPFPLHTWVVGSPRIHQRIAAFLSKSVEGSERSNVHHGDADIPICAAGN
jgi:triacylglycerol esterase/lipase EstA (alpha/beta hydrolase family)